MTLISLLPLGKILLAFVAILAGIRLRMGLFFSLLAGSILLGIFFGMGAMELGAAALQGLTHEKTLFLVAIVALILAFSDLLDHTGQAGRLLDSLSGRIRKPRLSLAFFPALIGLLPMPGGAVFSAPMVRTMAEKLEVRGLTSPVSPEDQALINYWYRHIWELCWPLYPGVILAASLSDINLATMALMLSPSVVAGFFAGWHFILRPATSELPQALEQTDNSGGEEEPLAPPREILRQGAPLLVAILGAILLELGIAMAAPSVSFEWGVLAALAGAMGTCALQNRVSIGVLARLFTRRRLLSMVCVVAAIFIFKEVLQVSGAVQRLSETAGGGAALFSAGVLLPFFVGMVSGLNIAFVGAALPLLLALLTQLGLESQLHAWVALCMFSGYAGVMASPLHLCFILTCQYFQVEVARAWRRLLPPCVGLIICGGIYFLILRALW